ncbi:hypothetical protein KKH65_02645 [bacterium]|nr:hypothetical protein [Planctomycetota bacterium]MBU1517980.1 hypothetical protein [Planctomycetota bacterium]MBU2461756.1 hypothetical protein [bacterium]
MKEMTRLNSPREGYIKKSKEALSKLQAIKGNFRKREKRITADLEKARKIWGKLGERFSWWQSLP